MEEAVGVLQASCEERQFLRISSATLKIIQNIQNEPSEERFRRLRSSAPFCERKEACGLLEALGFELRGNHYCLDETYVPSLTFKKKDILAARKRAGSILGWDIPFSMLKFTTAMGACKYGEVFGGVMEEEEVAIKTLKPDCGELARDCFDRELENLSKLQHPNVVKLLAVTLTSDPTCIILEFLPISLLEVLNKNELGDKEVVEMADQMATAMAYLHSTNIIHCDLGARNVRLMAGGVAKLCDFGLARKLDQPVCTLTPEGVRFLPLRWTAPEVYKERCLTVNSDLWSYGVFLYELCTFGSVPYASFSNQQVRSKVNQGYRLLQPPNCPDELYSLMLRCWLPMATERPSFDVVVRKHLKPLRVKVQSGQLGGRHNSVASDDSGDGKSPIIKNSRSSFNVGGGEGDRGGGGGGGKVKVKEMSYSQVLGKGGGLLRVATALVSPFIHRVVVVCGKKMTAVEVVQVALAKCGKTEVDCKSHSLALVNPHSSSSEAAAAHYLKNDDKVLAIKSEAPPTAIFVLCVFTPGSAILDIVKSIKQNPSFATSFDPRTRGYLVAMETGGTGKRGKQGNKGRRHWCVLDGSSLLCYEQEEDEGVKEFQWFVDVRNCSVATLSGKKSMALRVGMRDGNQVIFSTSDKQDMIRWIEALESAAHQEPSAMLLHSGDGVILQAGYLDCQEFALETSTTPDGTRSPPPPLNRRLGSAPDFSGTYSAVDYGRHWTVVKSSGLIQCLVRGRPETLFSLLDVVKVKVHHPKSSTGASEGGREGSENFCISLFDQTSRVVLQAECVTDHFDWVVAIERVLQDKGIQDRICGGRGNQSGYVTLKRLMAMQEGGKLGERGSAMQLYAMPRLFNTLDDVYDPLQSETTKPPPPPPLSLSQPVNDDTGPESPLSPPAYVNFVPPPPLPPRGPGAPPLPPKGITSGSPMMENSEPPEETDEEYVLMNPQSLPPTPRSAQFTSPPPQLSLPATPISAHHPGGLPSQPITIPGPGIPGKQAKPLLRSLSEISPSSSDRSLPHSLSSSSTTPGRTSSSALSSHPHTPSSHHHISTTTSSSLPRRNLMLSNGGSTTSTTSSGYSSETFPPVIANQSNQSPKPVEPPPPSQSNDDDVMVGVAGGVVSKQLISSDGGILCTTNDQKLPRGWRKGYCDTRPFYVNTESGQTTWNVHDVMATSVAESTTDGAAATVPGSQWQVVTLEDGQVYYYHETTRQTTWNVQDTFS